MDKIKLSKISTRAPKDLEKEKTKSITAGILSELSDLQNMLYAESKHSILVILQGMDASGKDGVIRNVFGAFNPQGVMVNSFKVPTEEELSYDFLWRIHKSVPAKGMIQVFNRSHYEDILVTRVHNWCNDELAKKRISAINKFEELITEHNNTTILKFYLHVSAEEQADRLEERMSDPTKQWKFNERDFAEAKLRDKYIEVYEDAFERCNEVPWTIVPSDQNWYKEHLIASVLLETLKGFKMKYPPMQKSE
jgi:PPK2 family polyphosphate:nucleotide phosphotransferase